MDAQVKKYLTKEKQFLQKLMVCMHVTGKHAGLEVGFAGNLQMV
jgi:hypothetical protein